MRFVLRNTGTFGVILIRIDAMCMIYGDVKLDTFHDLNMLFST